MNGILNSEEIIAINELVTMLKGVDDSTLDEAVQDAKSAEASEINNGGFADQVIYLVRMYGVDGAREIINGAVTTHSGNDVWGEFDDEDRDDRLTEARHALGQYIEPGQNLQFGEWIEDGNEFFIGVADGKPGFTHKFTVEFRPGTTRVIHIAMRQL